DSSIVHIRYIGTAGPKSTAYRRFEDDLKQRSSGLLSTFLRTLATDFPLVLQEAKAYSHPTLNRTDLTVTSQELVDERERILIALFGQSLLLNRQVGGFLPAYEPRADDALLFGALKTDLIDSGARQLIQPDETTKLQLRELFDDIEAFMNQHPDLTGTSWLSPPPSLKATMFEQAQPGTIGGHILMILVGKDITLEDFLYPRPFLEEGGSRAGHLLLQLFKVLRQWESGMNQPLNAEGRSLASMFPFVDLIPWPRHELCEAEFDFLGRYLRIAKPIITFTCSQLVSSVLISNLIHEHGLPNSHFLDAVGVPVLSSFTDPDLFLTEPDDAAERDPEEATIVMPALDPGCDKYGSQPEPLRRVMLLT
ncbi:hypothetical protein V8E36_008975, partial [Tilletia maclaganii]